MPGDDKDEKLSHRLISIINKLVLVICILVAALAIMPFIIERSLKNKNKDATEEIAVNDITEIKDTTHYWTPADTSLIKDASLKDQVYYGAQLVAHTSAFLGPKGSIMRISNGMNCQNCHLSAGTVVFGNNYGSVASLYPKFRARSGTVEDIYKRINDCMERSLNGKAINSNKELKAIAAYIEYIGSNVKKGDKAVGSGFKDLPWLDRAADPVNGEKVFIAKCQSCHQANGGGQLNATETEYIYPPLWGANSFNDAAGLYRLSNIAKYVKYNMPQGATHHSPQLSDEEAWDVAAFVISKDRPHLKVPKDWPDITTKPVDLPFGPYADAFTEKQHKYGPFQPIIDAQKKISKANR
jgi:thiosulfate dehydrogenase